MNKVAKNTFQLMIITLVAKILGFCRELVLASTYGTSLYSDAYLTSLNIPVVISAIIGGALATTFIPLYFEVDTEYGRVKSLKFCNNIFNIVIIISLILSSIGLIFTDEIVRLFAIGFKGEILEITVKFTRILMISIIFLSISNIMTSYLQAKNNFIIPGMVSIPYNIIIIISMVLSIKYDNVYMMIWGTVTGILSQVVFQIIFAYKNQYKYSIYVNLKDKYLRRMLWLVGPVFIGIGVNQINTMIDRALASTLEEGSISALNYANKLNGFIMVLFVASISTVIYPILSKISNEKNKDKFIKSITNSINSIIIMVIPITIGAIILAKPIVRLLFQRGVFDINATKMTSIALIFYSIGLIGFALKDIIGKVFYSLKDTKTPMLNGAISMIINIVLNIMLIRYMGHAGLAFATSISAIITVILLLVSLKKKIEYFGQDKIIKTTFKSIISSLIMGIITYFIYNLLNNILFRGFITEVISLFISIGIGTIVYGFMIIALKVEEANLIKEILREKLKNKNNYKLKNLYLK